MFRNLSRRAIVAAACAALSLQCPSVAALDGDKILLRGSASVGYDSNVLHVADGLTLPAELGGPQESDVYYGLGAGVHANLPISRQTIRLDASATKYWYVHFKQLDYTGYGGSGAWDWRVGNDWYGTLSAGVTQALTTYSSSLGLFVPSLYKNYNTLIDVHNALTPRWDLEASVALSQIRYNDAVREVDNFNQSTYTVAGRYTSPAGPVTGVQLSFERGESPNQPPVGQSVFDNNWEQYTLSALLDWPLTGHSRLAGNVGYTFRTQASTLPGRGDFNGISGNLTYTYYLSARTQLQANLYDLRGPVNSTQATYVKTVGIGLSASYQATGKTTLQANLSASQQSYLGSNFDNTEQRKDKLYIAGVGASYQATRTLSFSAGLTYQPRISNVQFGSYHDTVASIGGSIQF